MQGVQKAAIEKLEVGRKVQIGSWRPGNLVGCACMDEEVAQGIQEESRVGNEG